MDTNKKYYLCAEDILHGRYDSCGRHHVMKVWLNVIMVAFVSNSWTASLFSFQVYVAKYEKKWVRVQCHQQLRAITGYKMRYVTLAV